jgi:uncharacterized Ntn-hydrolase superfamily protein
MVADLIDLTAAGALSDAEAAQVRRLLARTVTATEAEAADRLAQRLRHGDASLWTAAPEHDAAAALLHHALAGAFDADYAEALRFQMLRQPLSDRSAAGGAWDSLRHALLPSRAEVAKIYRRSPSRLGYLGLLALRPFDLARRALRYAASAWRLRRKS